jgi:hypothetical protein
MELATGTLLLMAHVNLGFFEIDARTCDTMIYCHQDAMDRQAKKEKDG